MLTKEQNFNNALITFSDSNAYSTKITLLDIHGVHRFYVCTDNLKALTEESKTFGFSEFVEQDCWNFLKAQYSHGTSAHFQFVWLSVSSDQTVNGFIQSFDLPLSVIEHALAGHTVKAVAHIDEEKEHSAVVLSDAAQKKVVQLPEKDRRALVKALHRNFVWGKEDTIFLYPDGSDFLFSADRFSGGLCRHVNMITGKNGMQYQKITYCVHT